MFVWANLASNKCFEGILVGSCNFRGMFEGEGLVLGVRVREYITPVSVVMKIETIVCRCLCVE